MADAPASPWPSFQHDAAHTGQSPADAPSAQAVATVLYKAPQQVTTGIVLAADGTLLFGCLDFNLYAVSSVGGLLWKAPLGYQYTDHNAAPVVVPDGTPGGAIYAAGNGVFCFNAQGALQWKYPASGGGNFYVSAPLTYGADGTLYAVGSASLKGNVQVVALGSGGAVKWAVPLGVPSNSAVSIGPNGSTLYVATTDGRVFALSPQNGSTLWTYATGQVINATPAVGADGTVYVLTQDAGGKGSVVAVRDGAKLWSYASGEQIARSAPTSIATPAVSRGKQVYAGFSNLVALDGATGAFAWKAKLGAQTYPNAIVEGSDGTVFFLTTTSGWGIADAGGLGVRTTVVTGASTTFTAPAVAADGTVYFGGGDGSVYALRVPPPVDPPPVDPPPVDPPPVDPPPVDPPVTPPPSGGPVVTVVQQGQLVWATTDPNALQQGPSDASAPAATLLDTGTTAFGLAMDEGYRFYWSDGSGRIRRLDSGAATDVVTGLPFSAYGFAVSGGVAYVADPAGGKVWAVPLDGSARRALVSGLARPCGVAVDAAAGRLYWVAFGTGATGSGSVGTAALDGTGAAPLYTGLAHPQGLALDTQRGALYWVGDGGVYAGDTAGGPSRLVTALSDPDPGMTARRVAYDDGSQRLYVCDRAAGTIWTLDTGTGVLTALYGGLTNPTVLAPPSPTIMAYAIP